VPSENNLEIEVKIAVPDLDAIRPPLRALGFEQVTPRTFESNTIWDTLERTFKQSGEIVRLRQFGERRVLTFKGPALLGSKHKKREELESEFTELQAIERVFTALGLEPAFRYEKYRSEYQKPGEPGIVTFDETPIGAFLELEGSPAWIDSTAAALGFSDSQFITKSYAALYVDYCAANNLTPRHMVF
jgi:adenylate cyclase, class 2